MEVISTPIGYVTSSRSEPYDDEWDTETATITLDSDLFDEEALLGLDQFTHAEIVYHFDRAPSAGVSHGARHPRGNTDWPKAGIFAQRAKSRPNRIGTTELMRGYWTAADGRRMH